MKKTGFTLAEVLITLAIVGVIAAVTIPGLNRNVSQKSIGPTLAKAYNNLATVNTEVLASESTATLDKVNPSYLAILASKLNGVLEGNTFYGNDGISYKVGAFGIARGSFKKDGEISAYDENTGATIKTMCGEAGEALDVMPDSCFTGIVSEKYNGKYWPVEIDINGKKGKGVGGTDVFLVYVDTSGRVIPAGSEEAVNYAPKGFLKIDCNTQDFTTNDTGKHCTTTVMLDGWNVKY